MFRKVTPVTSNLLSTLRLKIIRLSAVSFANGAATAGEKMVKSG